MKRKWTCSAAAALLFVATILTMPVGADFRTWEGVVTEGLGQWHYGANWEPNGIETDDHLTVTSFEKLVFDVQGRLWPYYRPILVDQNITTDNGGSITFYSPEVEVDMGSHNLF